MEQTNLEIILILRLTKLKNQQSCIEKNPDYYNWLFKKQTSEEIDETAVALNAVKEHNKIINKK